LIHKKIISRIIHDMIFFVIISLHYSDTSILDLVFSIKRYILVWKITANCYVVCHERRAVSTTSYLYIFWFKGADLKKCSIQPIFPTYLYMFYFTTIILDSRCNKLSSSQLSRRKGFGQIINLIFSEVLCLM
jgi:hypothetical protein